MMPGINQTWWPDRVDRDPARGSRCTLDEYRELLEEAGFRFSKVTPIRSPMAVIEATA
jgi:hypothetical protein